MISTQRLQIAREQVAAIRERRSIAALTAPAFYKGRDPITGRRYWAGTDGAIFESKFVGDAAPKVGNTLNGEVIGR